MTFFVFSLFNDRPGLDVGLWLLFGRRGAILALLLRPFALFSPTWCPAIGLHMASLLAIEAFDVLLRRFLLLACIRGECLVLVLFLTPPEDASVVLVCDELDHSARGERCSGERGCRHHC